MRQREKLADQLAPRHIRLVLRLSSAGNSITLGLWYVGQNVQQTLKPMEMIMLRSIVALMAILISLAVSLPASADDWAHCRSGEPVRVMSGCTAIIDTKPDDVVALSQAYTLRGTAYIEREEVERAVSDFDRAISLNPNHAGAFLERGRAHEKQGRYALAKGDFEHAAKLFEETARPTTANPIAAVPPTVAKPEKVFKQKKRTTKPKSVKKKRVYKKKSVKKKKTKSKPKKTARKSKPKSKKKKKTAQKKKPPTVWKKVNKQLGCSIAGGFDC